MKKKMTALVLGAMLVTLQAEAENLSQIYQLATRNDSRIRAALAARDSVLEARPQARSLLLPQVSLSADVTRVRSDVNSSPSGKSLSNFNTAGLGLSLSQAIYRRDYLIGLEQADLQIAQAEASYSAEQQALVLRVAQAYFDVLSAQDSLTFAKAENAAIARQLEQAKQRFEVGLIAITSVHEAQAAFDQSRADLISAENTLDNAWEALREIIREDVGTLSAVVERLPLNAPEPADPVAWAQQAQQENLSIRALRYALDIARSNIELKEAADYPRLDLVGSHSLDRSSSSFGSDSNTTSLSLQLNMPLYTGGGNSSRVRQARLNYQVAQENLDKERRSVNRQVRDAYRSVLASISQVKALKASTVSAQSALDATQAGFEVGTRTMVDVLNAQRDLFRAKSNYAKVRYSYILSGLQLKQAAGTLSAQDLEQINRWLR